MRHEPTRLAHEGKAPTNSAFFYRALQVYYHYPWHALWRGVEAMALARIALTPPVLDIGCGDGIFAVLLTANSIERDFDDFRVYHGGIATSNRSYSLERPLDVGLDLEWPSLPKASALHAYRLTICADASHLPFKNESFSTVLGNSSVEHMPPLSEVIAETWRVLKPGGRLVLTVPTTTLGQHLFFSRIFARCGLPAWARRYADAVNRRLAHYNLLSADEWRAKLATAGFSEFSYEYLLSSRAVATWDLLRFADEAGLGKVTFGRGVRVLFYLSDKLGITWPRGLTISALRRCFRPLLGREMAGTSSDGGVLLIVATK
ncbi:MAG: class I SAM-dependent methyltransferase [Dehalococcoidia bacterium]|nr:class I SAM-dependent methyltransferase [Dehalococcoidia bacterium]